MSGPTTALPDTRQRINAGDLFFPAAILHSALTVLLSISLLTGGPGPSGLSAGHGQEMFFGFALALVAGYLGGALRRGQVFVLLALWLSARLASWFLPVQLPGLLLSICFALWLAVILVPRFNSAKKWRNRAIQPLLLALCLSPLVFAVLVLQEGRALSLLFPLLPLLLFALLMTYMGGRIIAPLMAAHSQQRKEKQDARVQPQIEGALIAVLTVAILTGLFHQLRALCGALLVTASLLLLVRWWRWRPWLRFDRSDLCGLLLGYLWLALGLMWLGYAMITTHSILVPMHMITQGAIGTLSLSVMLCQWYQRHRKSHPPNGLFYAVLVSLTLALVARLTAGMGYGDYVVLLRLSAICWAGAFVTCGVLMFLTRGYPHRQENPASF